MAAVKPFDAPKHPGAMKWKHHENVFASSNRRRSEWQVSLIWPASLAIFRVIFLGHR
jgi:hypothetical protein